MTDQMIQTELFRFAIPRPVQEATPDNVRKHTFECFAPNGTITNFHQQLLGLVSDNNAGALLLAEARKFVTGQGDYEDQFIADIRTDLTLPHLEYDQWLYAQAWPVGYDAALEAAQRIYKRDPADLIQLDYYHEEKRNLMDSVLAVSIDAHGGHEHGDHLVRLTRICVLLEALVHAPESLQTEEGVTAVLLMTPLLPEQIFPLPPIGSPFVVEPRAQTKGEAGRDRRAAQRQRLQNLKRALQEVRRLDRSALIPLKAPDVVTEEGIPQLLDRSNWVLKPEETGRLSKGTQALLIEEGFQLDRLQPTMTVQHLQRTIVDMAGKIYRPPPPLKTICMGDSNITFRAPAVQPSDYFQPFSGDPSVPDTVGYGRNVGVADLKIVQQRLLRYEKGEAAHIENVLKGEYKERVHRRLQRLTEELVEETQRTETTERDLESTEKFELKRESESVIKLDGQANVGLEQTAKYGNITTKSSFGVSAAMSIYSSNKSATDFSRSVTERAKAKVEERVLERRTLTSLAETEETNTHGVDNNKDGAENVVGIYRWLDKIYEAQIINYGARGLYEFTVPEPAALYLHAIANRPPAGVAIEKPEPPDANSDGLPFNPLEDDADERQPLRPELLDESTYQGWVSLYQVLNIDPPPAPELVIGKSYKEPASSEENIQLQRVEELEIPESLKSDYVAHHGYAVLANTPTTHQCQQGDYALWVAIGQHRTFVSCCGNANAYNDVALDGEYDAVPLSFSLSKKDPESELVKIGYAINVEVQLKLTDESFAQWQHKAYEAIMQAYQQRKADYDNQLAAASVQQGISISGRNPAQNREIEKLELKRAVIAQMTAQHFNLFDAMRQTDEELGYPEMDFDEARAEGEYAQFFEQAFEWENITYRYYPYFWGRKNQWLDRLAGLQDTDPIFEAFLKAGYARVVVPVRSSPDNSYDKAVAHFFGTGRIWNGGDPPIVQDPLYVSLVDDLKPKPVEEGDTWEIKLPTSLVILDNTLPGVLPSDEEDGDDSNNDNGQNGNGADDGGDEGKDFFLLRWLKGLFCKD